MTKYKALMSILVIAVVAVATVSWSPQVADARRVAQEGDTVQIPVLTTATSTDVAGTRDWTTSPEAYTTLADPHEIDFPPAEFAKTNSSVDTGSLSEDDVSPSCRRVCVQWREVCVEICDNAGNCTTKCVDVCCKWDLRDCYTG